MNHANKRFIFFIFFIPFWLFLSWLGNWQELSIHYDTDIEFEHQIKYGTVHMNLESSSHEYNNTVHVGFSKQGIFLDPIFIFSFKRPSLLFPWKSIKSCEERGSWIELELKDTKSSILIYDEDGLLLNQCIKER